MEQFPKPKLSTEFVPKVKPKIGKKRIVPNYGRLPKSDSGKIDLPTASSFGQHVDSIVHYFFYFLSACFSTANEFERFIGQTVLGVDKYQDLCAYKKKGSEDLQYICTTKAPPTFEVRPTVALRLHSPSGWTIIVRALLDTGCHSSWISEDLAQRLLTEGDASVRYLWPNLLNYCPFYSIPQSFFHRTIPGLCLQSLENEQLMTDKHAFKICSAAADDLPVHTVAAKLRNLGVRMFNSRGALSGKEMSMLTGKVVPNNNLARIDVYIGQDLLPRYFNINPKPPQYPLNDSLIIERTRMGLVFKGTFDEGKFSEWNPSVRERRRMKDTLYPREIMTMESACKLKEDAEEFKKILTVKLKGLTMRQMSSILPRVCLFLHLLLLLLMATGTALFLKSFNQLLLKYSSHFRLFSKLLSLQLSSFLVILYRLATYTYDLYIQQIVPIFFRLFQITIPPGSSSPFQMASMVPVAVQGEGNHDLPINHLVACLDTGSPYSYICPKVAQDLGLAEAVSETESSKEQPFLLPSCTELKTLIIWIGPIGKESPLKKVQLFIGERPFKRFHRPNMQPSTQEPLFKRLGFVGAYLPTSFPNNYDIILGTDLLDNHFPVQESQPILPDLSFLKTPLGALFQGNVGNLTMQNVLFTFMGRLLKEMTWKQTFAVTLLTVFYSTLAYLFLLA